jgi:AcrR family transcriptional regulator
MISRKSNASTTSASGARSLDRRAWLEAATDAIAEGGFGEARILTLAKKLGVTRGSFYWHFRDHDDFIRALLERWRDGQLEAMLAWRFDTGDAEADLRRAVHWLLTDMARDGKSLRVELAVQDFARRNALAAAVTVEVNRARMRQGLALFEALVGDSGRARSLTLLLYACVTGARLMLAASPRNEKTDAMAAELDRIIGEAIVVSNDPPRGRTRRGHVR